MRLGRRRGPRPKPWAKAVLPGAEVAGQHDDVAGPGERRHGARQVARLRRRRWWWRPRSRREQPTSRRSGARPERRGRTPPRRRSCRAAPPTRRARSAASPWAPSSTTSSPALHVAVGADVDHHLVHGDHADHRVAAAADEHLLARAARAAGTHRRRSRSGSVATRGVALDVVPQAVGDAARRPRRGFTKATSVAQPHRRLERHAIGAGRATGAMP